jgi:ERCC4-related helicase
MSNFKLIDNKRVILLDELLKELPKHKVISIASGYWDIKGTSKIIDQLMNYDSIRLLIGQEPILSKGQKYRNLSEMALDEQFPENEIKNDLEEDASEIESDVFRDTAKKMIELIKAGKLHVKLYRKQRLHAKAYIFGDDNDQHSLGIVGSSNFTFAGLSSNAELNSIENNVPMVVYKPTNDRMPHSHLSWFNELWDDQSNILWNEQFSRILESSPIGDMTFSPYESYIKTLMELYPEELEPQKEIYGKENDVLYSFQNRNAGLLIKKLEKTQVAILADSVGLGKTITAGAVIKHYLETGRANVLVISPASLKQQWIDDLAKLLNIDYLEGAFSIISQQDINAIEKLHQEYEKSWRQKKKIDLFVIDEAHNLRSNSGRRHEVILKLLQQHSNAHILLLTATPINNSLMDIANQIQLASKGKLYSVSVPFQRPNENVIEVIDFFEALKRIQSHIKRQLRAGIEVDYSMYKKTIHQGLGNYLVRSTRQGVEKEGVMKNGKKIKFPESKVAYLNYQFSQQLNQIVSNTLTNNIKTAFEGINPLLLNLEIMSQFTQQSQHPLDFLPLIISDKAKIKELFDIDDKTTITELFLNKPLDGLINNLLQAIYLLGFPAYRANTYKYEIYGKTVNEIRSLKSTKEFGIQLIIHNILHITWLKRLESSTFALKKSVLNYKERLDWFNKYLDKGYVVSLQDAFLLEQEYGRGDDIDQAFEDYDQYTKNIDLNQSGNTNGTKKGVEKVIADPKVFNLSKLKQDILRDQKILEVLIDILDIVSKPSNNNKIIEFANYLTSISKDEQYGKKVLVFSFFADTINYLRDNLAPLLKSIPNFNINAAFLTGSSNDINNIVGRFSPISKNYTIKNGENEINYLFATDILSEGQNLQDAGILINFDLHWNPVRMIQRNGRINRLGSKFEYVLINNMKPSSDIDLYLKLVNRLEVKINTIKNTVGLDQGVLSVNDINPIQFIERYYKDGSLPPEDDFLAITDDHVLNLREFVEKNKTNNLYINEIKSIPFGKWNYLPTKQTNKKILSLFQVDSSNSQKTRTYKDLFFMSVDPNDNHRVTLIQNFEALEIIKTLSYDNKRTKDVMTVDRQIVQDRVNAESVRSIQSANQIYIIDKQYQKALTILKEYFGQGIDFIKILQNGITDILLKKEVESLLREVNNQFKENQRVDLNLITKFKNILTEISGEETETKEILGKKGILYYVPRN